MPRGLTGPRPIVGPLPRGLPSLPGSVMGQGGRGSLFPIMEAVFVLPEMLDPKGSPRSRMNRIHTRAVKVALIKTMQLHHKKRIPQHFNAWKQKKYGYEERSHVTKRKKRGKDPADLVKTGRTKHEMQSRMKISVTGNIATGMQVKGVLRWPPGQKLTTQGKINRKQMSDEIARFTTQEEAMTHRQFLAFYLAELKKELSGRKRVRREIRARLAGLGVTL